MILIDSDFIYSKEFRDRVIRKSLLEEGYKIGFREGLEEVAENLITKMLKKGKSVSEIHELTDKPVEFILKCKEKME